MPEIVDMTFKRRKPERFAVLWDTGEEMLMTPETALKYQFSPGKNFEEETYLAIVREDQTLLAKDQLLTYLGIRPHSRQELFLKVLKKGYSKEAIEDAITALERVGLIDDEAFTRAFIQNELRLRPCGKRLLAEKLRQKGVMATLFEDILREAYDNNPPRDLILEQLQKQQRRHQHLDPEKKREKIIRFLLSRGFEWEQVREVIGTDTLPDED